MILIVSGDVSRQSYELDDPSAKINFIFGAFFSPYKEALAGRLSVLGELSSLRLTQVGPPSHRREPATESAKGSQSELEPSKDDRNTPGKECWSLGGAFNKISCLCVTFVYFYLLLADICWV